MFKVLRLGLGVFFIKIHQIFFNSFWFKSEAWKQLGHLTFDTPLST
jgi:hypothetical protein